ncbi:hypothetical protein BDW71DRAFT_183938 [Aspergillus fruticulosus]
MGKMCLSRGILPRTNCSIFFFFTVSSTCRSDSSRSVEEDFILQSRKKHLVEQVGNRKECKDVVCTGRVAGERGFQLIDTGSGSLLSNRRFSPCNFGN